MGFSRTVEGEDCAVIAPDNVREKIKQKVAAIFINYQQ